MGWDGTKTDWAPNDGVDDNDANRQEGNTQYLYDINGGGLGLMNSVSGLRNYANLSAIDNRMYIRGGHAIDDTYSDLMVHVNDVTYYKTFTEVEWSAGPFGQLLAPGVTHAVNKWFYTFMIKNPSTGAVDFQVDDTYTGVNISAAGFTLKRRINAFRTYQQGAVIAIRPYSMWGDEVELGGKFEDRQSEINPSGLGTKDLWELKDANNVFLTPPFLNARIRGNVTKSGSFNSRKNNIYSGYLLNYIASTFPTNGNVGVNESVFIDLLVPATGTVYIEGDPVGLTDMVILTLTGYADYRGKEGLEI